MNVTDEKSPETWEAGDHIENLKRGLAATGTCPAHADFTRALIWMIRRMDLNGNSSLTPRMQFVISLAKASPVGFLGFVVMVAIYVYAKAHGVSLAG